MEEFRQQIFVQQKYNIELKIYSRLGEKKPIRKVTNRLRAGILRAKWLTELEEEEDFGILTRFKEQYTKGYNDAATARYFLKDKLYTLIELYQQQYRQRHNDKQEDFYIQLNKRVV